MAHSMWVEREREREREKKLVVIVVVVVTMTNTDDILYFFVDLACGNRFSLAVVG